MSIIGNRLKQLRTNKSLTLRELGKLTNTSHSFLADIESGRSDPSVETLKVLADVLGATTDYLLGRTAIYPEQEQPLMVAHDPPTTIAAHRADDIFGRDDIPPEAKKSVEDFISFVKKQYKIKE